MLLCYEYPSCTLSPSETVEGNPSICSDETAAIWFVTEGIVGAGDLCV